MDKDGQPVVAIVGALYDSSMETWNPLTLEIKLLWEKIPILKEETRHFDSELLPINQGTGFLLYGGDKGYYSSDEIWKYSVHNNSWER